MYAALLCAASFRRARRAAQHEKFLAKVPILSTLSKYERFRLADALQSQSFKDGETIIKEGDAGDVFYIVEKGEVVCSKR
jgi:cAMP-dependent protein kinase regulator